ncbi:hypothetical protein [Duganella lactea]|uniref:hypothetical protein n=1 Tax=Duganella lactea TaxID=2692173 RepID=UPI0019268FD6|nr:hypothetical protein [Duganella lactea]
MNMGEYKMIEALVQRLEAAAQDVATKTAAAHYPVEWVKLDRYIELSGDTMDAVQARRKTGKWQDGEQCKMVDGRLWISLPAVDKWIEEWEQRSPARVALSSAKASKQNRSG